MSSPEAYVILSETSGTAEWQIRRVTVNTTPQGGKQTGGGSAQGLFKISMEKTDVTARRFPGKYHDFTFRQIRTGRPTKRYVEDTLFVIPAHAVETVTVEVNEQGRFFGAVRHAVKGGPVFMPGHFAVAVPVQTAQGGDEFTGIITGVTPGIHQVGIAVAQHILPVTGVEKTAALPAKGSIRHSTRSGDGRAASSAGIHRVLGCVP